ncbi:MAG: tetratricopeptide repeat protein [Candidatus Kapaibacterium sp.]
MKRLILVFGLLMIIAATQSFAQEKIWFANGEKALRNGKYDQAIENFNKLLKENPKHPAGLYFRGMAYLYKGEYQSAIENFDSAIKIKNDFADAYNGRGLSYSYLGRIDKALGDFNQAIGLDSAFTQAYLNRGSAYIALGEKKEALRDINKALALDPNSPATYYQRGRIYYRMDKLDSAISDFTKCLEMGLVNPKIYYNRGNAYYRQSNYEKAVADYSEALALDPTDSEALNNRAMAYDKMGKKDLALADRERLNELTGNNFPPIEALNFVTYSDPTGAINIELPDSWNKVVSVGEESIDMVIAVDEIEKLSDYFVAGVTLYYCDQMTELYNVTSPQEILDFWQSSVMQNSEDYYQYNIIQQKILRREGWKGLLNEVVIQTKPDSYPIAMYEYALAADGKLFFAYFQSPEVQFDYYREIFESAVESVRIGSGR